MREEGGKEEGGTSETIMETGEKISARRNILQTGYHCLEYTIDDPS